MLKALDESHHRAASAVLDELADEVRLAIFSGSLAVGLGHAESDLDIHIVPRDGVNIDRHTWVVDGLRVHVTQVSDGRLREIVEITSRFVATKKDRAQVELDTSQLWDIMRLASGVVIRGDEDMKGLFGGINRDVARQILMGNFARSVPSWTEDAFGLLGVGDLHSAHVCAVLALQKALHIALAGTGDLYHHDKFLFARLRRGPLAEYFPLLWSLCYSDDSPVSVDGVERRFWAANALVAAGLLDGWDTALRTPPVLTVGGAGPVRSPYWSLMRFADAMALAGPGQPLRLSLPTARVWALLDGRELSEVERAIAAQGVDVPAGMIQRTADQLIKAGAARPSLGGPDPASG